MISSNPVEKWADPEVMRC